ncbi:MAG: Wzz/FepE/Etk N-terminal domain-containing protein [Sediminibacterium sp.]
MSNNSFNMAETASILQNKWRSILLFTILTAAVATATVFLMPKQYRSAAKLISANPQLADKSRLFNENIQSLYSYFGSGDDLDRIMGIALLDTSLKQLVKNFNLTNYYKLSNDTEALLQRKAVLKLRDDLLVQRTEEGQLNISCWTKDPVLSAGIVNALVKIIENKLEDIWQSNYSATKEQLNLSITQTEASYKQLFDSLSKAPAPQTSLIQKHMETLLDQLTQYRKTAATVQLIGATAPVALYVLEPAVPAAKAERPDKPAIILAAAIAGFLFSLLLALLSNRKQA